MEVIPKECLTEVVRPDGEILSQKYMITSSKLELKPTWTSSV